MKPILLTFQRFAEACAPALLRACWQGALLIALIALLCRLLPRLPAATRCTLWWAACLKLLVTLAWTAPLILPLLPPTPIRAERKADPLRLYPTAVPGLYADRSPLPLPTSRDAAPAGGIGAALLLAIIAIWLVGAACMGSLTLLSLLRVHNLFRTATVAADPDLLAANRELAARLGMRHPPCLLLTAAETGPLAVSHWHHVVLMSQTDYGRLSPEQRQAVLAHEFAHIRRCDLWLGLVPVAAQVLFWFHPFVWLACREFAVAREAACDAAALAATRMPTREYSRLLLALGASTSHGSAIALGTTSDLRSLQRRIIMLHQMPHPVRRRWLALATTLLTCVVTLGLIPWRIIAAPSPANASPRLLHLPDDPLPGLQEQQSGPVTVGLSQPFAGALDTLARVSGIHYRLDPAMERVSLPARVTIEETGVSVEKALRDILSQVQTPLTFRIEQGVYVIFPGSPAKSKVKPGTAARSPGRMQLDVANIPLDQVLTRLFHRAHAAFRIDPAAHAQNLTVSVSIKSSTFESALSQLLSAVKGAPVILTWHREGEVYVISPDPSYTVSRAGFPPTRHVPDLGRPATFRQQMQSGMTTITMQMKDVDIRNEIMDLLNMNWQVSYLCILPDDLQSKITFNVRESTLRQALDAILAASPAGKELAYHDINGMLVLGPASAMEGQSIVRRSDKVRFTLRWRDVDPYDALQALFKATDGQFVIAPELRSSRITASAQNETFATVLQLIAAGCARPMKFTVQNGVYSFTPK